MRWRDVRNYRRRGVEAKVAINPSAAQREGDSTMVDECVVAVYPTLERAREAIHRLTDSGFPASQLSLVTVGLKDDPAVIEELKLSDDSKYDAAVAAGLGSVVGILSGLSVMVLSGLGLVFLVGPIGGGIVGGIVGAYMGALAGWGAHEHQIEHYQRLVEEGKALVIANGDPLRLAHAYRSLKAMGASEIHTFARMGDEAPSSV
jgi:uncharacterized membrane protein